MLYISANKDYLFLLCLCLYQFITSLYAFYTFSFLTIKIATQHLFSSYSLTCSFRNLHFQPFFAFSFVICLLQKTCFRTFKKKTDFFVLIIKHFTFKNLVLRDIGNFVTIFYFRTLFFPAFHWSIKIFLVYELHLQLCFYCNCP